MSIPTGCRGRLPAALCFALLLGAPVGHAGNTSNNASNNTSSGAVAQPLFCADPAMSQSRSYGVRLAWRATILM